MLIQFHEDLLFVSNASKKRYVVSDSFLYPLHAGEWFWKVNTEVINVFACFESIPKLVV